jgi:hypothetical protein
MILEGVWKGEGSIFSLIPAEQFVRCSWSKLKKLNYAVLSYQWRQYWTAILKFIFDSTNGVRAEYIWIDIFCLNQLDGNRMKTIRRMDEIYYHAKEYHIIELGSLFRGWILFELSSISEGIRPVIHTNVIDKRPLMRLMQEFQYDGFEGCYFTRPSDRGLVRGKIINRYGSVGAFNTRVFEQIDAIIMRLL